MRKPAEKYMLPVPTEDGIFIAHYSSQGLCGLEFPTASKARNNAASSAKDIPARVTEWHQRTSGAVQRALAGKPLSKLPPLDVSCGTAFQQQVWAVLSGIALGKTLSYGQVASAIGKPKAVRAVGAACGANPIPLLVPCHRVLAANRKIGGFSGGLEWKQKLLQREGVALG